MSQILKNTFISQAACLALIFSVGCQKQEELSAATDETVAVSSAVGAISGIAGSGESSYEQASVDLLNKSMPHSYKFSRELLKAISPQRAHATVMSCGVAARADACSSSTRSASYSSCEIGTTGLTYSGSILLSYSDSSCNLGTGDSISRTIDITRDTFSGGVVQTNSNTHTDFRGNSVGGGAYVERTGTSSYAIGHLGLRRSRTSSSGRNIYDISVRTVSDFSASGFGSGSATVDGGQLEVIHNKAEFVATFSADNLNYNFASCCYPVGGSLDVVYSGSLEGSASAEFGPACGDVTYTKANGDQKSVTLTGCE